MKKQRSSLDINSFKKPVYVSIQPDIGIHFRLKHNDSIVCSGIVHNGNIDNILLCEDNSINFIEDKIQEESVKQKVLTYIGKDVPNNIICFNIIQFNSVVLGKIKVDNIQNELVLTSKGSLEWEYEVKRLSSPIVLTDESAFLCNAFGIDTSFIDNSEESCSLGRTRTTI